MIFIEEFLSEQFRIQLIGHEVLWVMIADLCLQLFDFHQLIIPIIHIWRLSTWAKNKVGDPSIVGLKVFDKPFVMQVTLPFRTYEFDRFIILPNDMGRECLIVHDKIQRSLKRIHVGYYSLAKRETKKEKKM